MSGMYCLTVPEAGGRRSRSRCQQGRVLSEASREGSVLGISASLQLLIVPCVMQHASNLYRALSWGMCMCICIQISPQYKDTGHIGLRAPPPCQQASCELITSAVTLFPHMVTFQGTGSPDFNIGILSETQFKL